MHPSPGIVLENARRATNPSANRPLALHYAGSIGKVRRPDRKADNARSFQGMRRASVKR
jgi:hypothetical protein